MIKIGLTGGIGSGKSVVSAYLKNAGIPVYNCDTEAKRIMNQDEILKAELSRLLGDAAYIDGMLNRQYIADRIFNDKSLLQKVNELVHPAVIRDFGRWADAQHLPVVAMETAILFESSFDRHVDYIVNVIACASTRTERAVKRDNISPQAVADRISNQIADDVRTNKSHFVIDNNDNVALTPQIEKMLNNLLKDVKSV